MNDACMADTLKRMLASLLVIGHLCFQHVASSITTEAGNSVTLICPVVADNLEWIGPAPDNAVMVSNGVSLIEGIELIENKDLRIANVLPSHAGDYTCRRESGGASIMVTLHVNFPPSTAIIEGNGTVRTALDTGNATVTCIADSACAGLNTSGVNFEYYVDGIKIEVTEVSLVLEPGQYGGFITKHSVTFPVSMSMNGQVLTCRARNLYQRPRTGYVAATSIMDILYPPSLRLPADSVLRAYQHETFELYCAVDSNPIADITWYRVFQDSMVMVANTSNQRYLVFSHTANSGLEGMYRCVADNGIGPPVSKDVEMIVIRSGSLGPTVRVAKVKATEVTVQVRTSLVPFELPRYIMVQYQRKEDDLWLEVFQMVPDTKYGENYTEHYIELRGLQPGTSYRIGLRVVNQNGASYSDALYYSQLQHIQTEMLVDGEAASFTRAQYSSAILVSVFVTFFIMLVVLIVVVFFVRKGVCVGKLAKAEIVAVDRISSSSANNQQRRL